MLCKEHASRSGENRENQRQPGGSQGQALESGPVSDLMVHTYNTSPWEAEAGVLPVQG